MPKKSLLISLSLIFGSPLFAEEALPLDHQEETILLIDFVDVRDAKTEELLNIMEGKVENLAIHFPKGVSLPLKPRIKGDFFELRNQDAELLLEIKKDFYVRSSQGSLMFSSDLRDWKELEMFVTGTLFAGLMKNEADPVTALLEAEINERP